MKKLLKQNDLFSDMQYFEMIVQSFKSGQRSQAISQFVAMPKKYKIGFLKESTVGGWNSGISNHNLRTLFDNL